MRAWALLCADTTSKITSSIFIVPLLRGYSGYKNPESIAWCVNYLMGDLEATLGMGRNGKKLVETHV